MIEDKTDFAYEVAAKRAGWIPGSNGNEFGFFRLLKENEVSTCELEVSEDGALWRFASDAREACEIDGLVV